MCAGTYTQYHVVAVEQYGVAVDVEVLVTDADGDVAGQAAARDAVPVGDHHMGTLTVVEVETDAASGPRADEVMS